MLKNYITPWRADLFEEFASAREELLLVCPFIKSTIVRGIREVLPPTVKVRTISRFLEREFRQGVSDLEAHFWLSGHDGAEGFELRRLDHVHAKVFVVDRKVAFVGSSNLTLSGLLRNYESTVRIADLGAVAQILEQVEALWTRRPSVTAVDFEAMAAAIRKPSLEPIEREEEEHVYAGGDATPFGRSEQGAAEQFVSLQEALEVAPIAGAAVELKSVPTPEPLSSDGHPIDAKQGGAIAGQTRLEIVAGVVHDFQAALLSRFGRVVEPTIANLALAVRIDHLREYGAKSASLVARFNKEEFFSRSMDELENAGRAAYSLACFSVAVRSGLLSAYGIPAVEHFQREAERSVHLVRHWDRALLGPLPDNQNAPPSKRQRAAAVSRLMGLFVRELGFTQAMRVIEDGFNPLDAVSADIGTILSVRNPRSTLQELLAHRGAKPPVYRDHASEGPDHERVWSCRLTVGKFDIVGKGENKQEAETEAAANMLRAMAADPAWQRHLTDLRAAFFDRARRDRPVPLYPAVDVPARLMASLSEAFDQIAGFTIEPSLLVVAATGPAARSLGRAVDADNRTLAAVGARLIQLVTWLIADQDQQAKYRVGPGLMAGLISALGAERLVVTAYPDLEITDRQLNEAAQAVVAAVFLDRGFDFVMEWLSPTIRAVSALEGAKTPNAKNFPEWLESNCATFNPTASYTTAVQILQHLTKTEAVAYAETRTGPLHAPVFEVRASWDGLVASGRGPNVKAARQHAAFGLLQKGSARLPRHED